jgi:hypothetical protein
MADNKAAKIIMKFWLTLALTGTTLTAGNVFVLSKNCINNKEITHRQERTDSVEQRDILEKMKENTAFPLGFAIFTGLFSGACFFKANKQYQKIREQKKYRQNTHE